MSKDMVQPCRCFSKLIGPEDTSSIDMRLFRETRIHLLLCRDPHKHSPHGRAPNPRHLLHFLTLAWDPLLSSGSKFSKKENQQLQAASFHAKFPSVLGLLMFPKDLFYLYLGT